MMPTQNVLSWIDGSGLLVLAEGGDDVRARALERIAADGPLACLVFGGEQDDKILYDLQELGAPTGYVVDVLAEDDETIRKQVGAAAMVVISQQAPPGQLRSSLMGAAIDGVLAAYERGAVILAEGNAAAVFGQYMEASNGFGWVARALVMPGLTSAAESEVVRRVVVEQPDVVVIGIATNAAIALGGGGSLETWGSQQVTITLGNAYTSS